MDSVHSTIGWYQLNIIRLTFYFIDMHCMRPCDIKFMLSVVLNSMNPPMKTTYLTFVHLTNTKQSSDYRTNSYTFNRDSKPSPVVSKSFFKVLFLGYCYNIIACHIACRYVNMWVFYLYSFENNARVFRMRTSVAVPADSAHAERTHEHTRRQSVHLVFHRLYHCQQVATVHPPPAFYHGKSKSNE